MGYSIAVHCKSHKALAKMTAFMEKNYRSWRLVSTGKDGDNFSRFASNAWEEKYSHLSYDRSPMACGFDYNAYEPERDYIYAVTHWMCLKVGRVLNFPEGKAPGFYYDGGAEEVWPACNETIRQRIARSAQWRHPEDQSRREAFIKHSACIYDDHFGGVEKTDEVIQAELKRLDDLWVSQP